jgi:hypothetical protein
VSVPPTPATPATEAVSLALRVLGRWPSYTGLPTRVRLSEDETEYVEGRELLTQNERAIETLALVAAELERGERLEAAMRRGLVHNALMMNVPDPEGYADKRLAALSAVSPSGQSASESEER